MARPMTYSTRQSEAILGYIQSLGGAHVTAAQIVARFAQGEERIGRATVYRHLEKLERGGKLRRYTTDGVSGACYQYDDGHEGCHTHLHLKCEGCGELLHFECDELIRLQRHVTQEHNFRVDAMKTVLYGVCDHCLKGGLQPS